jgi:hypothetical protein
MDENEKPKLPNGSADWVEPTADEIRESVKTTPEKVQAAKDWAADVGGVFAQLLYAKVKDAD